MLGSGGCASPSPRLSWKSPDPTPGSSLGFLGGKRAVGRMIVGQERRSKKEQLNITTSSALAVMWSVVFVDVGLASGSRDTALLGCRAVHLEQNAQ